MTLRTVLLSLQSLLSSAEPDDPQDAVVAKQVLPLLCKTRDI
jgi:ubiquitin-conjugating enzyme (huntingtin interacting protein 2)